MKCLGIIGAMDIEVTDLKAAMKDACISRIAGMEFYAGTLEGLKAVVVKSGIGKVNAAVCTQLLVDRFGVDAVINTGVAGSLNAAIDIGDIVLSTDLIHHDMDAVGFGFPVGQVPMMDVFGFEADAKLRSIAKKACMEVNPEISVFEGRIASGDQFVSEQSVKDRIVEQFGGWACDMEGAAIAHTAWLNQIPFLVIRAISDKADGSASMDYPVFEAKAAMHSKQLTMRMAQLLAE